MSGARIAIYNRGPSMTELRNGVKASSTAETDPLRRGGQTAVSWMLTLGKPQLFLQHGGPPLRMRRLIFSDHGYGKREQAVRAITDGSSLLSSAKLV